MSKFSFLTVKDIRKETDQTVSIAFNIPDDQKDKFAYHAGQYLTIKCVIDGEEVRRSYSLCSSPLEDEWRIAVKKVPGGKFSTFANEQLKIGDNLEIMPPLGNFVLPKVSPSDIETAGRTYVFFASGSGITPVISLIKTILLSNDSDRVLLFYGNKYSDDVIFKDTIDGLKNVYLSRFSGHYIFSQERQESTLFNGRIDEDKCAVFAKYFFDKDQVDRFFICGPEQMIHTVKDFLEAENIPAEKIKFELFTTPTSKFFKEEPVENGQTSIDPNLASLITVKIDGDILDFPLSYGGVSILEGAIEQGADAPFACKGGVCCTCKALLVKGEVVMDKVYGLEQDEIDAGYILTCQAHPRTELITVDYDV